MGSLNSGSEVVSKMGKEVGAGILFVHIYFTGLAIVSVVINVSLVVDTGLDGAAIFLLKAEEGLQSSFSNPRKGGHFLSQIRGPRPRSRR